MHISIRNSASELHEQIDILVPDQDIQLNQLVAHLNDMAGMVHSYCQVVEIEFKITSQRPEDTTSYFLRKLRRLTENTGPQYKGLSKRELEVLQLILDGKTNREIADALYISFDTVKTHRKNILLKTNAKNTAALVGHYHNSFMDGN